MGPPSSRGLSAGGQILFGKELEKGNIQNVLIDGYHWKHKRRLLSFFARISLSFFFLRQAALPESWDCGCPGHFPEYHIVPIVCESEWDKSFLFNQQTRLVSRESFQGNSSRETQVQALNPKDRP